MNAQTLWIGCFFLFVFGSRLTESSKCSYLNVGKGTEGESVRDVVASGVVSEYFTATSSSKIMAEAAEGLDYFYISKDFPIEVSISFVVGENDGFILLGSIHKSTSTSQMKFSSK